MIERKRKIAAAVAKMHDAPYSLAGEDPRSGFNCLSYARWFYREIGVRVPKKYGGWTEKNYLARYRRDPDGAKEVMRDYFRSLGTVTAESPRPPGKDRPRPGDLVLFSRDGDIFSAICLGKGNYLTCDADAGIVVLSRRHLTFDGMEVIRCLS
jgi:cell wall-associated NlpC family hydrolase